MNETDLACILLEVSAALTEHQKSWSRLPEMKAKLLARLTKLKKVPAPDENEQAAIQVLGYVGHVLERRHNLLDARDGPW